MSSTFLTAEWRKLIMAQYAVDPAILTPWLPGGVELDFHRDSQSLDKPAETFVSLVGFLFDRVRIKGIPPPFHTRFEEVNLRFYVRRPMPNGSFRRGVVFLSELVPKSAITFVARTLYGENYRTAPTLHTWREHGNELDISYSWKIPGAGDNFSKAPKRAWQHLSVQADAQPQPIAAGTMEEFITEHYWGYTKGAGLLSKSTRGGPGITGEYGVEHPSWQVYPVRSTQVSADFGALYGKAFAHLTDRAPDHVLLAEGSAVTVREGDPFKAA